MKKKDTHGIRNWWTCFSPLPTFLFLLSCFCLALPSSVNAQEKKTSHNSVRSVFRQPPSSYVRVGNTKLFAYLNGSSYDILGEWQNAYYGATFGNNGYRVALKVDDNYAYQVSCSDSSVYDGIAFQMAVEQQSEFARVVFTVKNVTEVEKRVSLGIHGDIMIGNNDRAPIVRLVDDLGRDYGISMLDGQGAQLCALFGASLNGVTAVDDYWFGYYYQNNDPENMVGQYYQGANWMQENGSYDSGMGFCWKNRQVAAGETLTFSYLIGVGEVNLKPNSSFGVTPENPDEWNDLSLPHRLNLEGTYDSPLGVDGKIEYSVENDSSWLPLTDTLSSGSQFKSEIIVRFDPAQPIHMIHFRTIDNVGNTNHLTPVVYMDVNNFTVSGIQSKVFTGDSLYQTDLHLEVSDSICAIGHYRNNVNAGQASFSLSGVFPYSIGLKTYTFDILPQPLQGGVVLENNAFVYSGEAFTPAWNFTASYDALVENQDYTVSYLDNQYPGTGHLVVEGCGNYTAELVGDFVIDKAPLADSLYQITLPDLSTYHDGLPHAASVSKEEGVGEIVLSYMRENVALAPDEVPLAAGRYEVYAQIEEGAYYYGREKALVGSYEIFVFDEGEWQTLPVLQAELQGMGGQLSWDFSEGIAAVRHLKGVTVSEGHIVGLDLSGLQLKGSIVSSVAAFNHLQRLDLSSNQLSGDYPMLQMALNRKNPLHAAALKQLNVSHNKYSGNVTILSACYPNLESLNVSHNAFKDVLPQIKSKVTDLVLLPQQLAQVVSLNLTHPDVDALSGQIPTILIYHHALQTYVPNIRLLCTPKHQEDPENPFALQLMYDNGNISIPYVSPQKVYRGQSGDTINVVHLYQDGSEEGSTFQLKLFFEKGDANFIGGIDAADLQATILYAFGEYNTYPFNFTAANTFEDQTGETERINVQDVVCTVNLLLSLPPAEKIARSGVVAEEGTMDAAIYIEGNDIKLRSAYGVAALNVQAEGKITWDVERYGMTLSTLGSRMVGYSLDGATLPEGEIVIGHCDGPSSLLNVSAADLQAQPLRVAVGNHRVTEVETLTDSDEAIEIYDLSGRRTDTLKKGVNILRKNGKSQKQFILK